MNSAQDTRLVKGALRIAHALRGDVADGLVFHADRGTQFTSEQLWEVCRNLGVAQTVGRTGVCFDNAMAESFWSTLKTEFYDRKRWPPAMLRVRLWLTGLKSSTTVDADTEDLGMVSSVDFENHITQTRNEEKIAA